MEDDGFGTLRGCMIAVPISLVLWLAMFLAWRYW